MEHPVRLFIELEFISTGNALISDFVVFLQPQQGDLVHLVERQVRNLKVAGSSPVISTG